MGNNFLKCIVVLSFLTFSLRADDSWYNQKLQGWYYFEERNKEKKETASNAQEADAVLQMEKKKLQQMLSLALLEPTSDNVENYMAAQKKWLDQSAKFAAVWGRVLLDKPYLSDFISNPTTNFGILAKRDSDLKTRRAILKSLSQNCFILFFFKGKDYASEKAAEVAKLFSSVNGWKVKAVSLDGVGINGIEEFEVDKGLSQKVGVQVTPSFFAADPFDNKVYSVGAGLLSVSELEQNIELQMGEKELHD